MNIDKMTGKKIILFGAGKYGKMALNHFGLDKVHCFADNHTYGHMVNSKIVISFDSLCQMHYDYDVVISVHEDMHDDIEEQCKANNINYFLYHDVVFPSYNDYKSDPSIRQFQKKHLNKRCFLIGNGPSLKPEDLSLLHENKEITFACNAISEIFPYTNWRPKYFATQDTVFFQHQAEMLAETDAEFKFFPILEKTYINDDDNNDEFFRILTRGKGTYFFIKVVKPFLRAAMPLFSPDLSKAMYWGATVMYLMMQLATFMGFSKIYLLGVDGGFGTQLDHEKYLSEKQHFYDENDGWMQQFKDTYKPHVTENFIKTRVDKAYSAAEHYTKQNGIKIYNATRGGRIQVFERVEFDSLFS